MIWFGAQLAMPKRYITIFTSVLCLPCFLTFCITNTATYSIQSGKLIAVVLVVGDIISGKCHPMSLMGFVHTVGWPLDLRDNSLLWCRLLFSWWWWYDFFKVRDIPCFSVIFLYFFSPCDYGCPQCAFFFPISLYEMITVTFTICCMPSLLAVQSITVSFVVNQKVCQLWRSVDIVNWLVVEKRFC